MGTCSQHMACEYEEECRDIQRYIQRCIYRALFFCLLDPTRLSELEHTRDELLVQLYLSEESFVEKNTVSLMGHPSHPNASPTHSPVLTPLL